MDNLRVKRNEWTMACVTIKERWASGSVYTLHKFMPVCNHEKMSSRKSSRGIPTIFSFCFRFQLNAPYDWILTSLLLKNSSFFRNTITQNAINVGEKIFLLGLPNLWVFVLWNFIALFILLRRKCEENNAKSVRYAG